MSRVLWRGVWLDERTAEMMDAVAVLTGDVYVRPSQGSWSGASASAGTHSGCGAIDLVGSADDLRVIVREGRRVGFAGWVRSPSQGPWPWHAHMIAVQPGGKGDRGCLAPAAADQVEDYYEGRNGLANNGRDDGPRQWVGTTWETYTEEHGMPLSDRDIERIAQAVWAREVDGKPARWWLKNTQRIARRWLGPAGDAPEQTRQSTIRRGVDRLQAQMVQVLDALAGEDDPEPEPDPVMARTLFAAAGFEGEALDIILGIAWAESAGYADAVGDYTIVNDKWGPSVGLTQVRTLRDPSKWGDADRVRDIEALRDPAHQAAASWAISSQGRNFGPWTTYTNGAYKTKLGVDFAIRTGHRNAGRWNLDGIDTNA